MSSPLRIAIVSGSYRQGLSYQENVWAEELARLGHQVRVFTIGRRDEGPAVMKTSDGVSYEVQRVRTLALPRHIYFTDRLGDGLVGFGPERILWFGIPMYFGRALVTDARLAQVPVAAFFSLNVGGMHPFDWTARGLSLKARLHALAFHLLRGPDVVAGCLRATLVVANTPETRGILLAYPQGTKRARIAEKIIQRPLGFSPTFFSWDEARRASARAALGVASEAVVVAASSRFAPNKERAISFIVDALEVAMDQASTMVGHLIGLDGGAVSQRIEARVRQSRHAARFRLSPFADREALCAHFLGADVAVFARPTISCQEALATGIYVAFADDGSMDHLLTSSEQGVFFQRDDVPSLGRALVGAVEVAQQTDIARRAERAAHARWLGYDQIAQDILGRL